MRQFTLLFVFLVFRCVVWSQEVIPFQLTENGHIIVQVKLNDEHSGYFIFDTGAGGHVIGTKFFNKIKGTADFITVGTGFRHNGDRIDVDGYRIQSISLGSLKQENPFVGYFPPLDQYGVDGLISAKLYEDTPITIDYVKKEIRLENAESMKKLEKQSTSVPLYFHKMTNRFLDMFIELKLNDSLTCQAEFDTGSGFFRPLLNPFYMKKMNIDPEAATVKKATEQDLTAGQNQTYTTTIPSLSLSGTQDVRLEHVTVAFKEKLIYDGLIGSILFKDKVITIDIPQSRMLVHTR